MKLFFETSMQANGFLCMVPIGMLAAACMDMAAFTKGLRLFLDILLMLFAGMTILVLVAVMREEALRVYHLLGLLTGAILYTQGIGRLIRMIFYKMRRKQCEKQRLSRNSLAV